MNIEPLCYSPLILMEYEEAISKGLAATLGLTFFAAIPFLISIHLSIDRCRRNDGVPNLKYASLCTKRACASIHSLCLRSLAAILIAKAEDEPRRRFYLV